MEIKVSWGSNDDVDVLTDSVLNTFTSLETASMAVVYFNCRHDAEHLRTALAERLPCPFMLASSSNGVLASTPEGATARADLAIMLLYDKAGDYGCASLPISEDTPGQDARLALQNALRDSGAHYEAPLAALQYFSLRQRRNIIKRHCRRSGRENTGIRWHHGR